MKKKLTLYFIAFIALTINVHGQPPCPAPTGDEYQVYCEDDAPVLSDLSVEGDGLEWYADETGGTSLPETTSVENGKTYYVSQTGSDCSESSFLAVTVFLNPTPEGMDISVTPSKCGSGDNLFIVDPGDTIEIEGHPYYELTEDFDTSLDGAWTTEDNSSDAGASWDGVSSPHTIDEGASVSSPDGSQFYLSDASALGGGNVDTELIYTFTLSDAESASLSFEHYFEQAGSLAADVEISDDGGANYSALENYTTSQGTANSFAEETIDLDAYAGTGELKVRFHLTGSGAGAWAIDQFKIHKSGLPVGLDLDNDSNMYIDDGLVTPYQTSFPFGFSKLYFNASNEGIYEYEITSDTNVSPQDSSATTCGETLKEDITIMVGGFQYNTLCFGDPLLLSDLDIPNTVNAWYSDEDGTDEIDGSTQVKGGNTYYADLEGCTDLLPVKISYKVDLPEGDDVQEFCSEAAWAKLDSDHEGDALEDLAIHSEECGGLQWYSDKDGTDPISSSTKVVDNTIYYVSQIVDGCESGLLAVSTSQRECACFDNSDFEGDCDGSDEGFTYWQQNVSSYPYQVCDYDTGNASQISLGAQDSWSDDAVIVTKGADKNLATGGVNLSVTNPDNPYSHSAIRLNRASVGPAKITTTKKDFIAGEVFVFNFALILQDPSHPYDQQPFFQIRIYDEDDNLIQSRCIVSTPTDCLFNRIEASEFDNSGEFQNYNDVLYSDWSCIKLNTIDIQGQPARVEFTVADCKQTGHYGYVYIDDIYVGDDDSSICNNSAFGYVSINPLEVEDSGDDPGDDESCSLLELPDLGSCSPAGAVNNPDFPLTVCGTFSDPKKGFLDTFTLDIYQNGVKVGEASAPVDVDTANGTYCFTIEESDIDVDLYGEFTFEVNMDFSMDCGDPYTYNVEGQSQGFKVCPEAGCPQDMFICTSDSNSGYGEFDLTEQEGNIKGSMNPSDVVVTYYESQEDAESSNNPITDPENYTNISTPSQEIYARLDYDYEELGIDKPENCYDLVAFQLTVGEKPDAPESLPDYVLCEEENATATFDLSTLGDDILDDISDPDSVNLSYYENLEDAEQNNASETIADSTAYVSGDATVYIRVGNVDNDCFAIVTTDLVISPLPDLDESNPADLYICSALSQPEFDLTQNQDLILGDQDPNTLKIDFYDSDDDAQNNQNAIDDPEHYQFPDPDQDTSTVYYRVEGYADGERTGCFIVGEFDISHGNIETGDLDDLETCFDDVNNSGIIDLTDSGNQNDNALDGLSPDDYTISYYLDSDDAENNTNPITDPANYEFTSSKDQTVYIRVQSTDNDGCHNTDSFTVSFYHSGIPHQPQDLLACDDGSTTDFSYDLTLTIPEILGTQDDDSFDIGFYNSQNDANNDQDKITDASDYEPTNPNGEETIWVRIQNHDHPDCYNLTSFGIKTTTVEIGDDLDTLLECDNGNGGIATFDLNENKNNILTGQSPDNYTVTYYTSSQDAEDGTNAIGDPDNFENTQNPQIIYVRIEANNTTSDCYRTGDFEIEAKESDPIFDPDPLEACDGDNDGFYNDFHLHDKDDEITGGNGNLSVSYHLTPEDADHGHDAISDPYTNINPYHQTIYVRVKNNDIGCVVTTTLDLIIHDSPQVVDTSQIAPIELCDEGNGEAQFDLTDVQDSLLLGFDDHYGDVEFYDISYHHSQTDAQDGVNAIGNPATYLGSDNESIWVRVEDPSSPLNCYDIVEINLIVHPIPTAVQPEPLELCDDIESGSDTDEISIFDLTSKNAEIKDGNDNLSVVWYETQADMDNDDPIADPSAYANTVNAQTVFAQVNNEFGCHTYVTLTLIVNPLPTPTETDDLAPYVICDENNDGFAQFDLSTQDDLIANDETDVEITYYNTELAAEGGASADQLPNDYVNTVPYEQVIYARSTNKVTGCYAVVELTLKVVDEPEISISDLDDIFLCNGQDGSAAVFDLTQNEDDIYGNQSPSDFKLTYYGSEQSAENGNNPIAHPESYPYQGPDPMTIWVRLENPDSGCYALGHFDIGVGEDFEINTPDPLIACDDTHGDVDDEVAEFDLSLAIPEITGGNNSSLVTFYESQSDIDNDNPITDSTAFVNTVNPQTIQVEVRSSEGCVGYTTLTLEVVPLPSIDEELESLIECDVDNDGFAEFDLNAAIDDILNGQPDAEVSFHLTEAGAEQNSQTIDIGSENDPNLFENSHPDQQTIWVRIEMTGSDDVIGTGCYVVRPLDLIVKPAPEIQDLQDLYVCDEDGNGFAPFDLTLNEDLIFGGQTPPDDVRVSYHESQQEAEDGTHAIAVPSSYTNLTNPQTIYVRVEDTVTGCYDTFDYQDDNSFALHVEETPELNDAHLTVCDDDYEQNPYPQAVFDLSDALEDITGAPQLQNGQKVQYYASQQDMADDNPIANPSFYVNAANPQDIYVVVSNTNTVNQCEAWALLTIEVLPLPSPSVTDPDELRLTLCSGDNDGVADQPFNLTASGAIIAGGENVSIDYYTSEEAAQDGDTNNPDYIDDPENYVNEPDLNETDDSGHLTNIQIVYARVESATTGNSCAVVVPIELEVILHPVLNPDGDPFGYTLCEDGNAGQATLPVNDLAEHLYDYTNGDPADLISLLDTDPTTNMDQSTDLEDYDISYYTSETDAKNATNSIQPGYVATDGETIYVRVENIEAGCTADIGEIIITVEPRPDISSISIVTDPLCSDEEGGLAAPFDLTQYDDQINPGSPTNTEVIYYANMDDYNNEHPIDDPQNATLYNDQTIIAEVIDTETLCSSVDYAKIKARVVERPLVDLSPWDGAVICADLDPVTTPADDMDGSSLILDTGFPSTGYSFDWYLDGELIPDAHQPTYEVTQEGTYTVVVTNTATDEECESAASATIYEHNPPEFSVSPSKPAFSAHAGVVVEHITGTGNYEFSIDDGPWIPVGDDGEVVFTDVGAGEHFVHGRDIDGCGETVIPINLIDYPDFFTPNNDGHNDTWNIIGLEDQPEAKIYIFDRYGQLIKQITPDGSGWDGTFDGKNMPSNDYWFKVEYKTYSIDDSNSHPATFQGHFTLKR